MKVLVSVLMPQAFINTAREIYKKIQDGVFDVTNEVRGLHQCVLSDMCTQRCISEQDTGCNGRQPCIACTRNLTLYPNWVFSAVLRHQGWLRRSGPELTDHQARRGRGQESKRLLLVRCTYSLGRQGQPAC